MRAAVFAFAAAFLVATVPDAVRAAPVLGGDPALASPSPILQIRGGCGPGFHPAWWRDRWGKPRRRCVPNRRW
jgi:hypothetical protein